MDLTMDLTIGAQPRFAFAGHLSVVATAATVLLCLTLLAGDAHAASGLPTHVCHDFCGPQQQQMWARFERGESLDLTALPKVYAGVCHVLGNNINPEREHHVGFMIDKDGGHHNLRLRFSFFTSAQPYANLTAGQAREIFGAPVLPLWVHENYVYAEVVGRRFFARYWLRRERARTLLISYFGDRGIIMCDAGASVID